MTKPNAIQILIAWLAVAITITVILCSCTSTKYIDRVSIKTDTTAVHERDSILQVKKEDSVYYKNVIESMSNNDVQFRDTGSVKIEYRDNGSIKSIEGNVKSLNSKLLKSQTEINIWKTKYDSLAQVRTKDSIQVKTDYKTVEIKKKVTVFPWYFWLVCVAVLVVGWKLGKIKFV